MCIAVCIYMCLDMCIDMQNNSLFTALPSLDAARYQASTRASAATNVATPA